MEMEKNRRIEKRVHEYEKKNMLLRSLVKSIKKENGILRKR